MLRVLIRLIPVAVVLFSFTGCANFQRNEYGSGGYQSEPKGFVFPWNRRSQTPPPAGQLQQYQAPQTVPGNPAPSINIPAPQTNDPMIQSSNSSFSYPRSQAKARLLQPSFSKKSNAFQLSSDNSTPKRLSMNLD